MFKRESAIKNPKQFTVIGISAHVGVCQKGWKSATHIILLFCLEKASSIMSPKLQSMHTALKLTVAKELEKVICWTATKAIYSVPPEQKKCFI